MGEGTFRSIHGEEVHGVRVDAETRCAHWHSPLDIVAIKFRCCGRWFPCFDCHRETARHEAEVWPAAEFDRRAVLCGSCGHRLSITEYLTCGARCTSCRAPFNPGCSKHYDLYFEAADRPGSGP